MKAVTRIKSALAGSRKDDTSKETQVKKEAVAQEDIAMLAYLKWEARGCPHGSAAKDWLDAEAELKKKSAKS